MNQKHQHYDEADLPAMNTIALAVSSVMGNVAMREDAGILSARELDFVKAQTYGLKFPEMKGLSLVPMASDVPEWVDTITYVYYDEVGMAKIIANYADDLPRADVEGKEVTLKVKQLGVSYGYNNRELAQSLATGRNLPMRKAAAARRAIDVKLNQIAMVGDNQYGLYGLTNHPNIGITTLPSNKDWNTGSPTAQELLDDVAALYDAVRVQSKGVHTPNQILLPTKHLSLLRRTYLSNSNGKTVLERLQNDYPALQFVEVPELQAQAGQKSQIIIGEFDATNITHEMPQPFKQLPAEARNLEIVVNCTAASAGVAVHYPLAFTSAKA